MVSVHEAERRAYTEGVSSVDEDLSATAGN
jgi:hypothetical protein